MNTVLEPFGNLRNGLGCIGELLGYVLRFVSVFFHTRAFKLYWRWKSRRRVGRPPIAQEMQELIRQLSHTPYVFLVLAHGRRKVVHLAITSSPSLRWVIQQLRDAMPPYFASLMVATISVLPFLSGVIVRVSVV